MVNFPFLSSPHVWALFLAIYVIWICLLWFGARARIRQQPNLAPGYRKLTIALLLGGSLPWLIMGAGTEFGGIPGLLPFLRPREGNPFVLAWLASIVAIWVWLFYWVVIRRGAEFLVKHPGFFEASVELTPTTIRVLVCQMILGGVAGALMMFWGFPHMR